MPTSLRSGRRLLVMAQAELSKRPLFVRSRDSCPPRTHAGQAASSWVEPFRLPPRGRNLAKKANVGRIQMQRSAAIRSAVRLAIRSAFVLGVLAAGGASAQQAATDEHLTATQKLGRQVFAQSCGICHLPPQINARTYGPLLSKDTAGGSDEVIRGLISEGTPRMPAFKHYLERAEIDAIIAYLKTVPATATR